MSKEQLEKLLFLYKLAISKNLTSEDFVKEIRSAKIEIDQSFVKNGSEDENLGTYIEELYKLQDLMSHE